MHEFTFQLPITDPILLFGIGLFIILIIPILFTRIKLPGILGLIIVGLVIGPNGLHIIEREGSIELLGNIGLMYLMFLAGLELDMLNFQKVRNRSLVFGMLTFLIPFVLGYLICSYVLHFNTLGSLLIASMFSTHTLVSYPIVTRYRISKMEAVNITVGATIITDTIVLLLLIVITSLSAQELSWSHWLKLVALLSLYLLIVVKIYPLIGKWFFRHAKNDSVSEFVFVLFMVFLAGGLAIIIGIEPIIGAFLTGLSLNKLIPESSLLKGRLEFVGNALFIPFFLVYVGTFIDLSVFFQGSEALIIALVLTVVALSSKWIAAFFTQKIFRYNANQRKLIFGLSSSHAAATIAVIMVGYRIGIVDINVLNATILIILVTCLVSSIITENAAKNITVNTNMLSRIASQSNEKILVPIVNPSNVGSLLEFSKYLRKANTLEPIYALAVARDEREVESKFALLDYAKEIAAGPYPIETVARVDLNVASAIIRACKELQITDLVMGWNGKVRANEWFFGSILDQILADLKQTIFVVSLKHPLNTFERIRIWVPNLAQFEPGFPNWVRMVCHLSFQTSARINFYTSEKNRDSFITALNTNKVKTPYDCTVLNSPAEFFPLEHKNESDTFFILIGAREDSISYASWLGRLPHLTSKWLPDNSFAIVYPSHDQTQGVHAGSWLSSDVSKLYTDNNTVTGDD